MSLRSRLLAAVAAVVIAALGAASYATYSIVSASLIGRVDSLLKNSRAGFELAVSHGVTIDCAGGPRLPFPGVLHTPIDARPGRPGTFLATQFVEIRTMSGKIVNGQECPAYVGSQRFSPMLPATAVVAAAATSTASASFMTVGAFVAGGPAFRVSISRLSDGNVLIQGIAIADTEKTLHELLVAELLVSAIAVACAAGAGWLLVRVGLRPLREVSRTARRTTTGSLHDRVPVGRPGTEIGQLGVAFNAMLDQIHGAIAKRDASELQLRQFVADASHELRTPITAIAAYAELTERATGEDLADLERMLSGIRGEAGRMEALVEDLLVLARLDEGVAGTRQPVELVRLCADSIESATRLAPRWRVTLVASRPLEVDADEGHMQRVLANLLANVRQHTREGTETTVTVQSLGNEAFVEVRDDGEGMGTEAARHAFERFYRGDPSRSRLHGGSGLGLAIVRSIITSHGGSVHLESSTGRGTTVQLLLPLSSTSSCAALASVADL